MNTSGWRSPWPQWRTHWHVWHAWPLAAQALLLSLVGLCLSAVGSGLWSAQAWQDWWHATELASEQAQQRAQLHQQLQQMQRMQTQLQAQAHPFGGPWPAWQPVPNMDERDTQSRMLKLAQQHGLQLQGVNEEGGQWRGSLSQLLAACQKLAVHLPQQRLLSLDLQRLEEPATAESTEPSSGLPSTSRPPPVLLQMHWQWTRDADKTLAVRPSAKGATAGHLKTAVTIARARDGAPVRHNLFAVNGLAMALPPAVSQHWPSLGLQGQPVHEMQWMGMLSKAGQPQALVMHGGLIHRLQLGQSMGQDWGQVVHIAPDHLVLREWRVSPVGRWQPQTTRFPSGGSP